VRCDCCGSDNWRALFSENGIRLGQCPHCDLLSVEALPEAGARMTEIEEGHYAGAKKVLEAGRQLGAERVLIDQFRSYVDLGKQFAPTGGWLDIGCGAGLLLSLAAGAGYAAEGIELNADRRAGAIEMTGRPVHGHAVEDMQFADDSFDVISLINVFSHLTSPTETFIELRRILRPGGVLVMATGEMGPGIEKSHMYNWNLGDHLYFLGDRTMKRYGQKVGLEIVAHERSWFPDLLYSRDSLRSKGRSGLRNAVKTTILRTPGAFGVFRKAMLHRHADSAAYSSVFALRRVDPSDTAVGGQS
jgi:SAM-dependent methyltransferase